MVYQPMLELLDYLRVKGSKTFIVSGGGIEFLLRVVAGEIYGISPEAGYQFDFSYPPAKPLDIDH